MYLFNHIIHQGNCMSVADSMEASAWTAARFMTRRPTSGRSYRRWTAVGADYEGEIYALGGFNGVARMNSAEKYCPRTNQWRPIAEFCSPRSNFAVKVRISDCRFVVVAISMFQGMGRKGFKIDLSPIQIKLHWIHSMWFWWNLWVILNVSREILEYIDD